MRRLRAIARELGRRVPEAVVITACIWRDIGIVLFMVATYPARVLLRRRRRRPHVGLPTAIAVRRLPNGGNNRGNHLG